MEIYRIDELFDIIPGKGVTKQEYVKGKTPYISESATDNGIRFFINTNQILKNLTIVSNALSISSKTGKVFYHKNKVAIGQQTHCLKLKEKYPQDEDIYLYFASVIEHQTLIKASFGYQLSEERLPYVKIKIPSENKVPKWQEMKRQIIKIKNKYKKINVLKKPKQKLIFSDIHWQEYRLSDIFNDGKLYSCTSIDENKLPHNIFKNGRIPYVTRTGNNNAVKGFLNNIDNLVLEEGNCITIGLDTQTINYQPHSFVTGQNIIIIRHEKMNIYNCMFLVSVISNAISKFSWGSNGATLSRLSRLKVMLPGDSKGNLDWNYMENYIKSLEYSSML